MGIIAEMKEGLSIVEAEKFEKLANLVEFTKDEAFAEKLTVIKESVIGAVEAKEEVVTESVVEAVKPAYSHLV
jgi:Asp-tRNA(Asn)/Glu-tRNA(Gln) amidotransferase C subunit